MVSAQRSFEISDIDSTSLEYYYIFEASSAEGRLGEKINILSVKSQDNISKTESDSLNRIRIGEIYEMELRPLYVIVDVRSGYDSAYLSPAFMGDVYADDKLIISSDYGVYPYTWNRLNGLYLMEDSLR